MKAVLFSRRVFSSQCPSSPFHYLLARLYILGEENGIWMLKVDAGGQVSPSQVRAYRNLESGFQNKSDFSFDETIKI